MTYVNKTTETVEKELEMIRLQQIEIKEEQKIMKTEIIELQVSEKLQNREIDNIKLVLNEIKDDTKFLRRSVQGAVISTIVGLIVCAVWYSLGGK